MRQSLDRRHQPPTPSLRRLSELSPHSPMREIREVEAELRTALLRTGGSDHRTRRDILRDMRATVGLPPLAVPFGLPVDSPESPTPTAPWITPAAPPQRSVDAHATTPALENPLALVRALGCCPSLNRFSIECDSGGIFVHFYSFAYPNQEIKTTRRSSLSTHRAAPASRSRTPQHHLGRRSLPAPRSFHGRTHPLLGFVVYD